MAAIEILKKDVINFLDRKLPKDLVAHNKSHALEVFESAERLAKLEKMSESEKVLLLTAALLHDAGFIRRYENNESVGAEIAEEMLPLYGYSKLEIEAVKDLILSTRIPQKPRNLLEKIICDADLDNLGRKDFFKRGELLRKEWEKFKGVKYSDKEWYELQLKFLESHKYFTDSARKLRERGKQANIQKLRKMLKS